MLLSIRPGTELASWVPLGISPRDRFGGLRQWPKRIPSLFKAANQIPNAHLSHSWTHFLSLETLPSDTGTVCPPLYGVVSPPSGQCFCLAGLLLMPYA